MESEYQRKKNKIKQDVESVIETVGESENKLREVRDITEKSLMQIQDEKEKLSKLHDFINKMPASPDYIPSVAVNGHMDTLCHFMGYYDQSANIQLDAINKASQHMTSTYASTTVTSGTIATSSAVIFSIANEISPSYPQMSDFLKDFNEPTEIEKRGDVEKLLGSIDNLLADKFNEAFKTFLDGNFMSAAHAMREVLSGLGHELAPNEKVIKMPWYRKETETGKPSQRQRFKFAIIGQSSEDKIGEEEIEIIEKIAKEGREIYKKLNPEAHRREGKWEEERVRQYLSIGQNVIDEILLLRKRFFTESD